MTLISILYEDALNHIEVQEIRKRNEPQRTQRTQRKEEMKLKGFGAALQRNGITLSKYPNLGENALKSGFNKSGVDVGRWWK
ncbi:hypothetical protein I8752_32120 [Nostocaceae cyanobacterium CENA369]|uniref:Uncharacterized protein n=1 Tax=Dendronalium phyllosphericum CENA369 TaxID=1725256 RepID=A0A8J7ICQ0_9NOST|nr:hypothetical protein [Dendronalium phyllosphericum]MBH8577533.1 hypothetical protein [Dendronalium phyllosphericum CENA369]